MEDKIALILATTNKGKTAEIEEMLKNFPVDIKDLQQFGKLPEVEEDGKTFEENAYKKASFYSRILGFPTIADDSGLCVEALNGEPGIYSARYAGKKASDKEKYQKILAQMKNKDNRKAYFQCNISIAVPTGAAQSYEAKCNGIITEKAEGAAGFGYDPIFFYPSENKTFGQMTSSEKGKVSHRGLALAEVCNEFDKIMIWIKQQMPVFKRIHSSVKCSV
jgi:XTP/dITP diphosphohydrolase